MNHPSFSIENPNNIYATLLPFTAMNTLAFHDPSGDAYRWIADQVLRIDKINPMVAARVIEPLTHWKRYDQQRSVLMRAELERILEGHEDGSISDNIKEYVLKSLS
jgi:aminopeptidase N